MISRSERVDLFGRTEAEIVAAIGSAKVRLAIAEGYRGNEGIALKQETMRSSLRVDAQCLAELRGERANRDEPIRLLSGAALAKWRSTIVRMGTAGG